VRQTSEAGELELDRRPVAARRDEGVDAAHEGLDDPPGVRSVALVLGVEIPAIAEQTGEAVALDRLRPEHLGEPPLPRPAPDLHLPETVLGGHEPLREEEIVLGLGVDVGNAPAVAQHGDRAREPGDAERA